MGFKIPKDRGFAPNGNIFFHLDNKNYRDDFSKADPNSKALFLHEMTHAWQFSRNPFFGVKEITKKHRKYDYQLDENTVFKKLGVEQQAQVVQDAVLSNFGISQPYPTFLYLRIIKLTLPIKTDIKIEMIEWEVIIENKEKEEEKNEEKDS